MAGSQTRSTVPSSPTSSSNSRSRPSRTAWRTRCPRVAVISPAWSPRLSAARLASPGRYSLGISTILGQYTFTCIVFLLASGKPALGSRFRQRAPCAELVAMAAGIAAPAARDGEAAATGRRDERKRDVCAQALYRQATGGAYTDSRCHRVLALPVKDAASQSHPSGRAWTRCPRWCTANAIRAVLGRGVMRTVRSGQSFPGLSPDITRTARSRASSSQFRVID